MVIFEVAGINSLGIYAMVKYLLYKHAGIYEYPQAVLLWLGNNFHSGRVKSISVFQIQNITENKKKKSGPFISKKWQERTIKLGGNYSENSRCSFPIHTHTYFLFIYEQFYIPNCTMFNVHWCLCRCPFTYSPKNRQLTKKYYLTFDRSIISY